MNPYPASQPFTQIFQEQIYPVHDFVSQNLKCVKVLKMHNFVFKKPFF